MRRVLLTTAAAFLVLAIAAGLAAVLPPTTCGIEGAYFDRSVEAPARAGSFVIGDNAICWVPDVFVGAAAAFAICALTLALIGLRLRRRGAS
jgi:hypothetical protein